MAKDCCSVSMKVPNQLLCLKTFEIFQRSFIEHSLCSHHAKQVRKNQILKQIIFWLCTRFVLLSYYHMFCCYYQKYICCCSKWFINRVPEIYQSCKTSIGAWQNWLRGFLILIFMLCGIYIIILITCVVCNRCYGCWC